MPWAKAVVETLVLDQRSTDPMITSIEPRIAMMSEIFVTFEAVGKDPQVVAVCLEASWGDIVNRAR